MGPVGAPRPPTDVHSYCTAAATAGAASHAPTSSHAVEATAMPPSPARCRSHGSGAADHNSEVKGAEGGARRSRGGAPAGGGRPKIKDAVDSSSVQSASGHGCPKRKLSWCLRGHPQPVRQDEADFEVPTPTAKKLHSRSSNYTTQEDEALIMAWENVTLDAVKGTDQTSSTYWSRIYDHYHRNKKCVSDRSLVSLQHRWSTIQECCNKWAGCMVQVERQSPSGVPYQEHINLAQELYKGKKPRLGKPFVMLHCWVLLQHNQKWLTRKDEAPPKRQKSRNSSLQFEGVQDVVDDEVLDEDTRGSSPTTSSEAPTRTRPPGRKAEKEKLKRGAVGGAYKEVFQEMLTKREEMEARKEARWIEVKAMEERKAAFKERKVAIEEEKLRIMGNKVMNKNLEREQKIMFMDTSCLDDQQKAYVSTMRAHILAAQMGGFQGETSNGSYGL